MTLILIAFFIPLSHRISHTLLSVMLLYDSCTPPGGHITLQWVAAGAKRQLIGHSNMLSYCSSQHVQKNYGRNVDVSVKIKKIELENVESCKKKSIVTKSGCLIAPKMGRCWTWVGNKEQTLAIWKPGSCNRWHLHRQYSVAQQQGSRVKHL